MTVFDGEDLNHRPQWWFDDLFYGIVATRLWRMQRRFGPRSWYQFWRSKEYS